MLGVNSIAKRGVMQHYISVSGLSRAWVTSENSTKQLECRHLDSSSSLDPILSATGLRSPVLTAPVRGSTPTLCCSPLCCPAANCPLLGRVVNCPRPGPPSTASLASPSHFRIRRDFMSKNPLSGFAPKQTKESSALAGNPYSATRLFFSKYS